MIEILIAIIIISVLLIMRFSQHKKERGDKSLLTEPSTKLQLLENHKVNERTLVSKSKNDKKNFQSVHNSQVQNETESLSIGSESRTETTSKVFTCPSVCSECLKLTQKSKVEFGNFSFELNGKIHRGFEFIVAPMGFSFSVGGKKIFAAFTPERRIFHFTSLSNWELNKSTEGVTLEAHFVKSSQIQNTAFYFEENFYQGYGLFLFNQQSELPYLYGALFSLFPSQVKKAGEFFYIPPLAMLDQDCFIVGLCKQPKLLSLIIRFKYKDIWGTFRVLPGKRKFPLVLEKLGNTPGELLPKALHLPYLELLLFGRSFSLKTYSFGEAFELAYLREQIPKSGFKKLLTFLLERPEIPEIDYILRLYLKYEILPSKTLAEFANKLLLQTNRKNTEKAFAHRVLAEYYYFAGKTVKSLEHAKKAISLDENVGVKRLIAKLEKTAR